MTIDAKMVKQLRDETGAAVLDCKKALEQYDGDFEKAKAYLAEKGLATAKKKADRATNEGTIHTYTHPGGRVGVMVEVNCESDFVAKTEQFQSLAHDVALHVAFANPSYLDVTDIPADIVEAQKKAFTDDAKAQGKPDNIVERIVEGRLDKWYAEVCLLRQPFVKDDELSVADVVTNTIAEIKENIRIGRFVRFTLDSDEHEEE